MTLNKLAYKNYFEKAWKLKPVELDKINLLVAKNATGKTRSINTI
ncbi:hypothetical protein FACS1894164_18940 [Spirochaetia bacterium]|nr:hypothetical protein FACS1894164_18940 [Spirochaetia bacterium]